MCAHLLKRRLLIGVLLCALSSCSLIDDDLSVCGVDCKIDYELRLVADLNMSIHAQLRSQKDSAVAKVLENWITPIFAAEQNEAELFFFSTDEADELREHSIEQVTERHQSFTFYLPRDNYLHLASVNVADNGAVTMTGGTHSASMCIETKDLDILPSQKTALYTARYPLELDESESQSFEVNLYAASSAVALVLDSSAFDMRKIEVLLEGTASCMTMKDSTFLFGRETHIRLDELTGQCFGAISLPSRDEMPAAIQARHKGKQADVEGLWQLKAHVTLPDGKVTETILSIDEALLAGTIRIIQCEVQDDGSLLPVTTTHVGATVTLDWKEGDEQTIDI